MKKTYSKPEIEFESFTLCTRIASCAVDTDLMSQNTCGIQFGPTQVLFVDETTGCNFYNDEAGEKICYHNPSDDNNLFNS